MLKALYKKQWLELNAWLLQNKKTGKPRGKAAIAGLALLYALLLAYIGVFFFFLAREFCAPLLGMGLGWLYFLILSLVSLALGVFGSVFNTYASLYQAKDNDLLLSLPIPPRHILLVRLFGVWFWGFLFSALVFVPALLAYWLAAGSGLAAILIGCLLLFCLSAIVLTLSCLLGWCVARVSTRLKNKSLVTVLLSLVFLAAYYYLFIRAEALLQKIIENALLLGAKIKGHAYLLYLFGRACEGQPAEALGFTLGSFLLLALIFFLLSRSFLKLATTNRGAAKRRYQETTARCHSMGSALRRRELRHFLSSPVYMLNCALGTLLLPVLAVFLFIKADALRTLTAMLSPQLTLLFACAALCMLGATNDLTAPSVSLEGRSLWLMQSLPVPAWQALKAKLALHLMLTLPPTLLCAVCMALVLGTTPTHTLLLLLLPSLFVLFSAAFGLFVGIKLPNLKWANETVPVKQSGAVLLSLFGGWGLVLLLGLAYYLLRAQLSAVTFLLLCALMLVALSLALLLWLKRRGAERFSRLS